MVINAKKKNKAEQRIRIVPFEKLYLNEETKNVKEHFWPREDRNNGREAEVCFAWLRNGVDQCSWLERRSQGRG